MKDMRMYEKYLNMQPKKKKKKNFTLDNKYQNIGILLFGVGLFLLGSGVIMLLSKNYVHRDVVPADNDVKSYSTKKFEAISTEDGSISIDGTEIIYKKDEGLSEFNLVININSDISEIPIKIIFDLNGKDVVIAEYLTALSDGESITLYKQSEYDLSLANNWRVEVTTKEDLETNYGITT